MSGERPWMKFYPQSWRSDEMLRNCSLAARGLWIEMIALMHTSERYGFLLINGKVPSDRQLQRQTGAESSDEISQLIAELEQESVFSRDPDGVIFSRKMVRDAKSFAKASNFGKRGVRAKALKGKEESEPPKGGDEGSLNGSSEGGQEGALKHREQSIDNPPISPKVKGRPKPKIPIPDDWEPKDFGEGSQSRAIVDSWSPLEFQRQVDKFKAHHKAAGNQWADWQSTWSTWVLNSVDFAGPRRGNSGGSGPSALVDEVLADYAPGKAKAG